MYSILLVFEWQRGAFVQWFEWRWSFIWENCRHNFGNLHFSKSTEFQSSTLYCKYTYEVVMHVSLPKDFFQFGWPQPRPSDKNLFKLMNEDLFLVVTLVTYIVVYKNWSNWLKSNPFMCYFIILTLKHYWSICKTFALVALVGVVAQKYSRCYSWFHNLMKWCFIRNIIFISYHKFLQILKSYGWKTTGNIFPSIT